MARHCSLILCTAVAALVVLGLIMLTSTGAWVAGHGPYHFLTKQATMVGIGVVAAIGASWMSPDFLRRWAPWMLLVTCVLLVLCYVPGIAEPQWGSNRWIKMPIIGQFQPSEVAKIILILALGGYFARWQTEIPKFWRGFVIPGMIAAVPIALIAAETDVGTALSLSVAVGVIMFCLGTRLLYTLPTALAAMGGAFYFVMNDPVRRARIDAWLDLDSHQLGTGMQQYRSLLALGSGGPWGVGLGNGVEKFGRLTFAYTDFIFPVIGEELGLIATLGVVLCYVLIGVAGCGIAMQATNIFNRCIALGLTSIIVVPAMQNIAVLSATAALVWSSALPPSACWSACIGGRTSR